MPDFASEPAQPRTKVTMEARPGRLPDGTPVITRTITPGDGPSLAQGLQRLSPQGNAYRFLHYRKRFTEEELHYLTHCDFVDHIALVLAATDEKGNETDRVGVARCVRTESGSDLAEAAIVLVDDWQHRGAGTLLLRHLADLAVQAGIRRWQTLMFQENVAAERLFARVATEIFRRARGFGTCEIFYALRAAPGRGWK